MGSTGVAARWCVGCSVSVTVATKAHVCAGVPVLPPWRGLCGVKSWGSRRWLMVRAQKAAGGRPPPEVRSNTRRRRRPYLRTHRGAAGGVRAPADFEAVSRGAAVVVPIRNPLNLPPIFLR